MRPALRLSWLEIRPSWQLRGYAVGTRRDDVAGQSEAYRLSDSGKRRRCLGLYGAKGIAALRTRLRMDARAGDASLCVEDLRELQLSSGARRRPGYLALVICALQQTRRPLQSAAARPRSQYRSGAHGLW